MNEDTKDLYDINVTVISNNFLEKHLADANSEYVRVYIYYLWKKNEKMTVSDIADALNLTENDVERALKYWTKQKVLQKNAVSKISNHNQKNEDEEIKNKSPEPKNIVKLNAIKKDTMPLKEAILYAEKMLPAFSSVQKEFFKYMYEEYDMSAELIEYLVDFCIEKEVTTNSYMKKIATSWYEQGIKTVEEAKSYVKSYSSKKYSKKGKEPLSNSRQVDYDSNFFENLKKRVSK